MLLYIKILATKSDRAVTYNITYLNPTVTDYVTMTETLVRDTD